ncbi:MAG TPA: hypothetical protein DEB39_16195 [Planctomycetaceae bacterium]|nr:hypothetical protein [Planctomycetaceae bacterium]
MKKDIPRFLGLPGIFVPRVFVFCISVFCVFAFPGCRPADRLSGLVPGSGIVTHDGIPVEKADVVFSPVTVSETSRAAGGTTDAQGRFSLSTLQENDGIFPGEYIVSVRKTTYQEGPTPPGGSRRGYVPQLVTEHLPKVYLDPQTSGLNVSISNKGDKNIELKLTGKPDLRPQPSR